LIDSIEGRSTGWQRSIQTGNVHLLRCDVAAYRQRTTCRSVMRLQWRLSLTIHPLTLLLLLFLYPGTVIPLSALSDGMQLSVQ